MPTYEWKCQCGNIFETKWPRPSSKKTETCGKCGHMASKKVSLPAKRQDCTVKGYPESR